MGEFLVAPQIGIVFGGEFAQITRQQSVDPAVVVVVLFRREMMPSSGGGNFSSSSSDDGARCLNAPLSQKITKLNFAEINKLMQVERGN